METLAERIERVLQEQVSIVPYDLNWPRMFAEERDHLLGNLPREMIGRIEHFGSTAIPGLAAKPIVDMLVEVRSLEETKSRLVPVLEAQGYGPSFQKTDAHTRTHFAPSGLNTCTHQYLGRCPRLLHFAPLALAAASHRFCVANGLRTQIFQRPDLHAEFFGIVQ